MLLNITIFDCENYFLFVSYLLPRIDKEML